MMKPGRELDALIAEKVMGWKHEVDSQNRNCDGKIHIRCMACGSFGHGNCYGNGTGQVQIPCDCTPYFSTDIAVAWEVVEKLRPNIIVGPNTVDNYVATWNAGDYPECWDWEEGESAPHAICLAALRAIDECKPES